VGLIDEKKTRLENLVRLPLERLKKGPGVKL
jgi:hypothetical protein